MTEKEKTSLSKFMSLVLRHCPERIGLKLDDNGWADVDSLILGVNKSGRKVNLNALKEIVLTNDKQRFKFSEDYSKIRASQGHSVTVDLDLKEVEPPKILYHGTVARFLDEIKNEGLVAKNRLHVHLSADKETAEKVGKRRGKPVILEINALEMSKNGIKFYLSDNGVWLTAMVPYKYIKIL